MFWVILAIFLWINAQPVHTEKCNKPNVHSSSYFIEAESRWREKHEYVVHCLQRESCLLYRSAFLVLFIRLFVWALFTTPQVMHLRMPRLFISDISPRLCRHVLVQISHSSRIVLIHMNSLQILLNESQKCLSEIGVLKWPPNFV